MRPDFFRAPDLPGRPRLPPDGLGRPRARLARPRERRPAPLPVPPLLAHGVRAREGVRCSPLLLSVITWVPGLLLFVAAGGRSPRAGWWPREPPGGLRRSFAGSWVWIAVLSLLGARRSRPGSGGGSWPRAPSSASSSWAAPSGEVWRRGARVTVGASARTSTVPGRRRLASTSSASSPSAPGERSARGTRRPASSPRGPPGRPGGRLLLCRVAPRPEAARARGRVVTAERAIVFDNVSKFYGEVLGVNRVTLSIPPGDHQPRRPERLRQDDAHEPDDRPRSGRRGAGSACSGMPPGRPRRPRPAGRLLHPVRRVPARRHRAASFLRGWLRLLRGWTDAEAERAAGARRSSGSG